MLAGACLGAFLAGPGCGGSSSSDAGIAPAFTPTFTNIKTQVFAPVTGYGCTVSNCHTTGAGPTVGNLDLLDNPYYALLGDGGGAPAVSIPGSLSDGGTYSLYNYAGFVLVQPGNPTNSLLYQKLNAGLTAGDSSGCLQSVCPYGEAMPNVVGEPLPANYIEAVREWIADGAQNN